MSKEVDQFIDLIRTKQGRVLAVLMMHTISSNEKWSPKQILKLATTLESIADIFKVDLAEMVFDLAKLADKARKKAKKEAKKKANKEKHE